MAFTFAAFSYIIALIVDAFLIFFAIFHVSKDFKTIHSILKESNNAVKYLSFDFKNIYLL